MLQIPPVCQGQTGAASPGGRQSARGGSGFPSEKHPWYRHHAVSTTLFLVRSGWTELARAGRIVGRRDVPLAEEGVRAVREAAARLDGALGRGGAGPALVCSPLRRAVESAGILAERLGVTARLDERLTNLDAGRFEGALQDEVRGDADFQRFLADPGSVGIPHGETLVMARRRAVAAVEDALAAAAAGGSVVAVTHAAVVRLVLTFYLGMPVSQHHRLRIDQGSLTVLRFPDAASSEAHAPPRILAVNQCGELAATLR